MEVHHNSNTSAINVSTQGGSSPEVLTTEPTCLTRNPPKLDKEIWDKINSELCEMNKEEWTNLSRGHTTPEVYVDNLNVMLANFLKSKVEFQRNTKEFFKHNPINEDPLEEMRKLKMKLNKDAKKPNAPQELKEQARQAIRTYSHMIKIHKEKKRASLAREQDKCYRKNFWKTARDVTNGTFGEPESTPTYSKSIADQFYKSRYEDPVTIDFEKLKWFPNVEAPSVPYDLSPYTPKDIRSALLKKNSNSAPGYDDIVYEYLQKLPYLHKTLATTFTKIRDKGVAPEGWGKSKIVLIKKDINASDEEPTNFRMISLTLNVGKLYHTLEASRTLKFMLENKYLDPTAQKAYVDGVNGCMEHVTVVHEIIQHAKLNHKTVHATWFDLMDAFGSVSHDLIPYVMSHYHIPKIIITYITSLYSKLQGQVFTKEWQTELFQFLRGVFQGDPFSGIIFLIVFNPIVQYIKKQQETHGYPLVTKDKGAQNVITTPFADDFNLITRNKSMHQNLVSDIEDKIKSMGLVLKPKKCRSLSIESGNVKNIKFNLKGEDGSDILIDSVIEKPLKFLGSIITGNNTPSAMFAEIISKLETKLTNIDRSTLRGEFKLNIYTRYALPSMRYFLSVHQMHKTHMEKLDDIARKYIKIWLGIQKHGVSDAAIFHPYMLKTKMPSQLYLEAHATNYAMIRSKGDMVVNHALDSRVERESAWKKKFSTVTHVHRMWQENIDKNNFSAPHENETQHEVSKNTNKSKKAMLKSVQNETTTYWNERVKRLAFQGNFIQLLIEEKENITWRSISNNIPKGVLSFALKASVNGLNTPDNLKRWGIRQMDKCCICRNKADLQHILNWCPVALDQKRFTWRHNSVLKHLTKELLKTKPDNLLIYSDLPGHDFNGGTIPPDILTTTSRPDLVFVYRESKEIKLFELTCSFESNIDSANKIKFEKYQDLKKDLESAGWRTELVPFEVGSRGFISKRNITSITKMAKLVQVKKRHKSLLTELSQVSLLCSFTIFQARTQPTWQEPPYLHP